jgi:tetratricopeptide (TPR) repeat protein
VAKAKGGDANRVAAAGSVADNTPPGDRDARLPLPAITGVIDIQQIPPSMRTGMFQLPPDIDDFTGRDDALRTLRDLLEPSDEATAVVVSVIAGQAGVGKTALVTRVAHQLRPSFPHGQLYINLRGPDGQLLRPSDVLTELLLELGLARATIPDRLDQRAARYRAQLADRRILVVLDNAAEEAQVRPLLPDTPGSAALITSQTLLGGLEATHAVVLDVLQHEQAVELLAKVVGAERVAAEPEAARTIVELCGYLPLAIRLARAKLDASGRAPLAVLANRLAGEHGRLAEFKLRDPEVRASFALNYEDLDQDERQIFRLLGLLKTPDFSAWVATALLDGEPAEAEELIERLVKAEVLEVAQTAQETPNGQVRYQFHDLLRVLARERLWSEESSTVQASYLHRTLGTYLGLASRATEMLEPGTRKAGAAPWPAARFSSVVEGIEDDPAAWFTAERLNLIAAIEQAYDSGLWQMTWELAESLTYFFKLQTHWTDWQLTQQLALRAARRAGNRHAIANALRSLGDVHTQLGQFMTAVAELEQALTLFQTLGDRLGGARTLVNLGNAYREQGVFDEAIARFEPALRRFRALADPLGEAWALEGLGVVSCRQGRFGLGTACFEEALILFHRVGDRRGEAYCLLNLGTVYRDKGQARTALHWLDQAQPIFRELDDRHGEINVLLEKGHMLREQGRLEEAGALLEACLAAYRQSGGRTGEAWTRFNLGMVHHAQGRIDAAIAELDQCRALFADLGDRRGAAWTSIGFGHVDLAQGKEESLADFERAALTLREIGDQLGLAKALQGSGLALAATGDRTAATARWREAVAILRSLGASESTKVEAWLTG